MLKIGFATSEDLAHLIDDDLLAAKALASRGAHVRPLVWTQGDLGADLDAIVVRSCWDYHLRPAEFHDWLSRIAAKRVFNSADVLSWNLDKHYLADLGARGVPIPKTVWVERGSSPDLNQLLEENGLVQAVIKPAISLTAYKTFRVSLETAPAHQVMLNDVLEGGDAMIQEFLPEIITEGERSFVFFGGAFSHVIEKRPKPGDFRVQSDFGGTWKKGDAKAPSIARAQSVLKGIDTLYARVDMVPRGEDLVLMELELLDPVLFFALEPSAPAQFVDALIRRIQG